MLRLLSNLRFIDAGYAFIGFKCGSFPQRFFFLFFARILDHLFEWLFNLYIFFPTLIWHSFYKNAFIFYECKSTRKSTMYEKRNIEKYPIESN